jgi:hypothetical protein
MKMELPFDFGMVAFFARGNKGDIAQWINEATREKPIERGEFFPKSEQTEILNRFVESLTQLGYQTKAHELLDEVHAKKKSSLVLVEFYIKCSKATFRQMRKLFNELSFSSFEEGAYLLKTKALKQIVPLYRVIHDYLKEIDPQRAEAVGKMWAPIFNPPQNNNGNRNYLSRLVLLGADEDAELNRLFNITARKTVFRDLNAERDLLITNMEAFSLQNKDKLPSFDVSFFELSEEEMEKNLQIICDLFSQHTGMKRMIVEYYYREKESYGSCSYEEANIFVNSSRFKNFRKYHCLKTELQYLYEEKASGKNCRSYEMETNSRIQEIRTDLGTLKEYANCTKKELVNAVVRTTWHELIHAWIDALREGDVLPKSCVQQAVQKDLILLNKTAVPNVSFAQRHFNLKQKEGFELYLNSWEESWVNEAAIKLSLAFRAPERLEIPSPNLQNLDIKSPSKPSQEFRSIPQNIDKPIRVSHLRLTK